MFSFGDRVKGRGTFSTLVGLKYNRQKQTFSFGHKLKDGAYSFLFRLRYVCLENEFLFGG